MKLIHSNDFDNSTISCRIPKMLKNKVELFGTVNDLSMSQIIRKGLILVLNEQGNRPSQWQI
jgi:hypothetical protein